MSGRGDGRACGVGALVTVVFLVACSDDATVLDGSPQSDGPTTADAKVSDGPSTIDSSTTSDGSLGDGPTTGPLTCPGYTMPSFSKGCGSASDCVVVTHQTDCCGNGKAIGVNAAEKARFEAEEKKCAATYPGCGCPAGPPVTEDGSTALFAGKIGVDCVSGSCTTYLEACGKVCAGEPTCRTCQVQGQTYGACSKQCGGDTDCTDPALPSCVSDGFGGKFCAAEGVACGT